MKFTRPLFLILAAIAVIVTVLMWFVAERNVSRPLHLLVEEAKTIDVGELK